MALLDILIALIVGVAAIGGFTRGLVQEVLSLASWIMAALALHFLHPYLSEGAVLGPIDRVLGFGFGGVKGALIAVFAFALLVTGFDDSWGYSGRPQWITGARTYAAADAFSRQLLPAIAVRRERLRGEDEAREAAAAKFK